MNNKIWEKFPSAFNEWDEILKNREPAPPVVMLSELAENCQGQERLQELFDDMKELFYDYAEIFFTRNEVAEKYKKEPEEFKEELARVDGDRKRIHNATIDSIFILARNMEEMGKDAGWISKIGGGDRNNRAAVMNLVMSTIYFEYKHYKHKEENYA